ncbi:hypothetical protein D3C78_1121340 [compost metagenome]
MRHHQPDETDRPANGCGGAAEQNGAEGGHGSGCHDILAKPGGEFIAERQRIQLARRKQADDEAGDQKGQHGLDAFECRPADTADLPGADAAGNIAAGQDDGDDERGKGDGGGGTRKSEFQRGRPASPQRTDDIHENRRRPRTGNCGDDEGLSRGDAEPDDADDDGKRRSHVHTENAGICKRIAGDALHDGPGQPECGPGKQGEQRARQTHRNRRFGNRLDAAAQPAKNIRKRDVTRADGDGERTEQCEKRQHCAEPCGSRAAGAIGEQHRCHFAGSRHCHCDFPEDLSAAFAKRSA